MLLKATKLEVRPDSFFKVMGGRTRVVETPVSTSLPVYLLGSVEARPDHKDNLSILVGGVKRLFAKTPFVSYKLMRKILRFQRRYIFSEFKPMEALDEFNTNDWITQINHPEKRKEQLREAYRSLLSEGPWARPGYDDDEPSRCNSFIKDESYPEEKALRWINSSSDKIKVLFGPLADRCMHILVGHDDFIKTVPVAERAKAIFDMGGFDAIVQSTDATSMEDHYARYPVDRTVHSPIHQIANQLMLHMMGSISVDITQKELLSFIFYKTTPAVAGRDALWDSISSATQLGSFLRNVINGYRILKMRNFGHLLINSILCSGEMDTSFRNGVSMRTMVKYATYDAALKKGYKYHELSEAVYSTKSKHEGDDSIALHPPGMAPDESWWEQHGWLIKVEFRGKLNEASFCGLVFDEISLQSVPDIRSCLSKFGWTNRKYVHSSERTLMGLLRSKALSMSCEYHDVPILGAVAERLLYLTRSYNIKASIIDSMDMFQRTKLQGYLRSSRWKDPVQVSLGTRNVVARLQQIPVSVQLACERHISTIGLGSFSLPWLDFSPPAIRNWANKISCRKTLPYYPNLLGRRMVCDHLVSKFQNDCPDNPRLHRMIRQLHHLKCVC